MTLTTYLRELAIEIEVLVRSMRFLEQMDQDYSESGAAMFQLLHPVLVVQLPVLGTTWMVIPFPISWSVQQPMMRVA